MKKPALGRPAQLIQESFFYGSVLRTTCHKLPGGAQMQTGLFSPGLMNISDDYLDV